MGSSRRHLLIAGAAWLILSAAAVALIAGIQVLPEIASREAEIENRAFVLLTVLAAPVLMFVVVGLVYSAWRFRAPPGDDRDGPAIHGDTAVQAVWVGISAILVLGLFVYGAVGLLEIRGATDADYLIQARAEQWEWHFVYPGGVESDELHVPVGQRVEIDITSDDVLHSLWVPAFGVKQDAVPGRVTRIFVSVDQAGVYRGQCAELCGLGHTVMLFDTTAQTEAELDAWLADQPAASAEPS